MEQTTTHTGTLDNPVSSREAVLPNTEVPQHYMGGPRFGEQADGPEEGLASVLKSAKTNGWGMQFFSWMRGNRQLLLGITGSLILAIVAIVAIRSYVPSPVIDTSADNAPAVVFDGTETAVVEDAITINPVTSLGAGTISTQEAVAGEGITHLARRAITARAQEKNTALTPEQRIYAEDYVQNAIGDHALGIGEKLSFPHELVDDAIAASQTLSDAQLQNLAKYSALAVFD